MEKKIKKAVIREDLLSITSDYREAIILNQFVYWSDRIKDADILIQKENEIAKKNGEEEKEPFYGWIYKTAEDMAEEVMLGLSPSQIRRYINSLIDKGFLLKRTNPKYKWDRTLQYKVNLLNIARALRKNGYPLSDYKIELPEDEKSNEHPCAMENAPEENRKAAGERAIPENTYKYYNTDTTTSETTGNALSKDKVTGGNASSPKREKEVGGDPLHKGHITDYTDEQLIRYIDDEVDKWMDLNWNILPGTTNDGDIDYCVELKKIILYFYRRYKEVMGKNHPIISETGYYKIVDEYMSPPDDLRDGDIWGLEDYKEMIDKYFTVDFGKYKTPEKKIELSLSHFMSKKIREHLAHQSGVL